jgi:hypothetical protein
VATTTPELAARAVELSDLSERVEALLDALTRGHPLYLSLRL